MCHSCAPVSINTGTTSPVHAGLQRRPSAIEPGGLEGGGLNRGF